MAPLILVKFSVFEPAAWEQAIYRRADRQGPGHMCDVGWITGSPESDLALRPNWYSKAALICGVNDPETDAVLDKERNAATPEERLKILQTETFPTIAKKVPTVLRRELPRNGEEPERRLLLSQRSDRPRQRLKKGSRLANGPALPRGPHNDLRARFFLRRQSQGVVIVLLVALLIFTLLRVVPGDPVRIMLDR